MKYTKDRLFEMMNRVGGMPLYEENNSTPHLPSWAMTSANDFIPLEKYEEQVPCSTNIQEVETDLNPKAAEIQDPIKWLQDKDAAIANKTKQDVKYGGRLSPVMMGNIRKGEYQNFYRLGKNTDFNKLDYNLEELATILTKEPTDEQLIGQNGKMEKTNFFNISLPAYRGVFYDISSKKFFVINICDKAETCTKYCFAQMGNFVKNDPVIRLNAQKLNYLLNFSDSWKKRVIAEINILFDGVSNVVVRWHDSGDFFSEEYMKLAFEVANETNFAEHYAYTKEISTAKKLENIKPENFEFKYSFGGSEDNLIDKNTDAHAVVVPKELFADLQPDETKYNKEKKQNYIGKGWNFSPEAFNEIKRRIAEKYNIDVNTIVSNAELKNIPYRKNNPRKWNVIAKTGDNDVPALRRDVLGIYMLIHK